MLSYTLPALISFSFPSGYHYQALGHVAQGLQEERRTPKDDRGDQPECHRSHDGRNRGNNWHTRRFLPQGNKFNKINLLSTLRRLILCDPQPISCQEIQKIVPIKLSARLKGS